MRARIGFCLIAFVSLLGAASPAGADNRASIAAARQNATNDATLVPSSPSLGSVVPPVAAQEYVLGTGDRVRLTVYGEDDLSGEYEVNSTGRVALPLVGNIDAANRTVREFEEVVRAQLNKGYLKNPRVSAQVASYRPFFILGEVAKPGNYAYVNGMTVLNAVAMAGGYTYRADTSGVVIVHANDASKTEQPAREDATVMPGDIVRVPERFF